MKKYTLLGHVFELEDNAYHFLARYIERVEHYSVTHSVSTEVIDDIKYSIIEKLYGFETPITEKQVIDLANSLGEPEVMFDESVDGTDEQKKFRRTLQIDKEKPMIRGVCYRLSKSLNLPVRIVRIIMLLLIIAQGTGLILYVILALFVPFKDKKRTTGAIGNLFFEIVRVVFWLFIISAIVPITVASTVVTGLIFFTPVIDNQSISAWVPQYMYIVGILVSIAFFLLSLGAIGSLFKQRRINKTLALLATIIILAGAVVSAGTAYKTMMLAMSHHTIVKQELIVAASTMSGDRVNLDLTKINSNNDRWDTMLGNADILLIRTTGTDIKVMVESTLRGRSDEELESIASKLIPLTMTGDKNNIEVGRQPNAKIFSEEVPLSMVQRHVVISVPANQEVYINKNRRVNMAVQNDASDVRVSYCDAKVYVYNEDMNEFTCKDDVWYDEAYDHIDMEGIIEDRVSERAHQRMNQSFDAVPPMYPENETGSDKDQ